MDTILAIIMFLLIVLVSILVIQLCSYRKRVKEMEDVLSSILDGQKKRQIFSRKNDELGKLAFKINRLAGMYGTAEDKYEKEQLV